MERRALVVALALTLPLALYGVPYAYASTTSSSYQVQGSVVVALSGASARAQAFCNSGDYATGGGFVISKVAGLLVFAAGATSSSNPGGWQVDVFNPTSNDWGFLAIAICQSPVTVAGIGVPEFGSLYVAIAVGAMVYFMLARRYSKRPMAPIQNIET